ncbi:CpsD/CapB family tyrosine-protein kinase [Sporosarcina sp. CAU 1771]
MGKKKKRRIQTAARKLITHANPRSVISEQYRTIRTNINFSIPDKHIQTLLVTSSSIGEGKSTSAANIAIVFAQAGKKILLIDADMRKPTVHHTFQMTNIKGLSNVLTRQWGLEDVVKSTEEGIDIITCGQIPPNPAELLELKSMDILMSELKVKYDFIIFDAPPILSVADAQILANKCDGTILVISAGKTEKEHLRKAIEVLQSSKANILGSILNNYKLEKSTYYYQYSEAAE